MPELVVNRVEVLLCRRDTHLDAHVGLSIDVPRARVTDDVSISRAHEQRSIPERCRQRLEAERGVEALADAHHLMRVGLPALEDFGQRVAGIGSGRGHQRIDVGPILRPDVPEQMHGQRAVGRHGVAVLVVQLHPYVRVQLQVQRAHLTPEPVELPGELVGWHVIFRSPHLAGLSEPELSCSLVRQLDEPRVVGPHRRRDCVPPLPHAAELGFVSGFGHHPRDVVDVEAALRLGWIAAPLAFAVGRAKSRRDLGQLLGFHRIGRRDHHERELQQIELTALGPRDRDVVEGRGFHGKARDGLNDLLCCAGVQRFRIVGDVGLRHPAGLALLESKPLQRHVHVGEKLRSIGGSLAGR